MDVLFSLWHLAFLSIRGWLCVHFHLSNLMFLCTFSRFSTLVGVVPDLSTVKTANRSCLSLSIDFHGLSLTSVGLSYSWWLIFSRLRQRPLWRCHISLGHRS